MPSQLLSPAHGFCGFLFRHGLGRVLCNPAAQTFVSSRTAADLCGSWKDSHGLGGAVRYGTVRGAIPELEAGSREPSCEAITSRNFRNP